MLPYVGVVSMAFLIKKILPKAHFVSMFAHSAKTLTYRASMIEKTTKKTASAVLFMCTTRVVCCMENCYI